MNTVTYTLGDTPTIIVRMCDGDLKFEGAERSTVELGSDRTPTVTEIENVLEIDADGDLRLLAPLVTAVVVKRLEGDARLTRLASLVVERVQGRLDVADVSDACTIGDAEGDVRVARVGELRVDRVGGAARVRDVVGPATFHHLSDDAELRSLASVEAHHVGGDLSAADVEGLCLVHQCHGDVRISNVGELLLEHVNGDADVAEVAAACTVRRTEGDLQVNRVGGLTAESVQGDAKVRDVSGQCVVRHIAGDALIRSVGELEVHRVEGDLEVGDARSLTGLRHVGGDARLYGDSTLEGGAGILVEGDLSLDVALRPGVAYRVRVEGDARIGVRDGAGMSLSAVVGGDAPELQRLEGSNRYVGTWGDGSARVELEVGGDLAIASAAPRTVEAPHSTAAGAPSQERDDPMLALLEAVARGEVSPEEADAVLLTGDGGRRENAGA